MIWQTQYPNIERTRVPDHNIIKRSEIARMRANLITEPNRLSPHNNIIRNDYYIMYTGVHNVNRGLFHVHQCA